LGILLFLPGLVLPACATPFRVLKPPVQLGRVRAFTREDACKIQAVLSDLEPKVRAMLHSDRKPPFVWMSDQVQFPGMEGVEAYCSSGGIVLLAQTQGWLERILSHELAHWYSFDQDGALPEVLEEGIAVYTSIVLPHRQVPILTLDEKADWRPVLELKNRMGMVALLKSKKWSSEQLGLAYYFGYWLVHRIGLEKLWSMHAQGHTSIEDILTAAGLPLHNAPRTVHVPLLEWEMMGGRKQENGKPATSAHSFLLDAQGNLIQGQKTIIFDFSKLKGKKGKGTFTIPKGSGTIIIEKPNSTDDLPPRQP